jgi:hypothetical protein
MSTMNREDVEFPTFDGLTLRGWLFPGTIQGPAIVMNQGVRGTTNFRVNSDFSYRYLIFFTVQHTKRDLITRYCPLVSATGCYGVAI